MNMLNSSNSRARKGLAFITGFVALAAVTAAQAQTATVPDMDAKIDDAAATITKVLVVVGSTVVFFTILAIYKWVKKR